MKVERTVECLWSRLSERSRERCITVARRAAERGERAYLVGGSVRDLLLGTREVDLDIVVEGDACGLASALATDFGGQVQAPSEFLTAAVDLPEGGRIDLATARQETYPAPAKLPIVGAATIAEDLQRRDFSVNAMALWLLPEGRTRLVDPCGGRRDVAAGIIRILHDRSFIDDPTRLIRAVRFEQRLGFEMEPATAARLGDAVRGRYLTRVSGTRVRDEIIKLLAEPAPWRVLERLKGLRVLDQAVPGALLDGISSRWLRKVPAALIALRATEGHRQVPGWPYLLGALCARGEPEEATTRLQLDREARSAVEEMGRAARGRVPGVVTQRTYGQHAALDASLGSKRLGELLLYWLRGGPLGRLRIEHAVARLRRVAPDISGDELIAAGAAQGPAVGVGLRAARLVKLGGDEAPDAQLKAAYCAIRRWQRPPRRRRSRPAADLTEGAR